MGNTPSIVMDTDRAILGILHLFSPSLPIGAFAFSQGLEAAIDSGHVAGAVALETCLLYTSPSPRDQRGSRMPSSA